MNFASEKPAMSAPKSSNLNDIYKKVADGERLSRDDGLRLYASNDLPMVGHMANITRERMNAGKAFYIINRHINYSNVCKNQCKFCAFSKEEGEEGGYSMGIDEVMREAEGVVDQGATEIHIVGGLHPKL
ncbi:MAG: radical SAM protein, partial [Candidatus Bathyanammoxibius sp.]